MPPWEMVKPLLLGTLLPPFVLAVFVTAFFLLIAGRKHATFATVLGVGVAIGVGLWLRAPLMQLFQVDADWTQASKGDFWLSGTLTLQDGETSWNRLPWVALAALWIGRVARFSAIAPGVGWLIRAAASLGAAWLVIPPEIRKDTDWLLPAFAAVIYANWALLEFLAADPIVGQAPPDTPKKNTQAKPDPRGDGSIPVAVALALFTAGMLCIHAHSARLMETAFVVGAAFTGLAIIVTLCQADAGGAIPAAAVLLPGLMLMTHQSTFSEIPWYGFALPAFAPLILTETLPIRHWRGIRLHLIRVILIAIPLIAALLVANHFEPLSFDPNGD